jgi:hypothetical protein
MNAELITGLIIALGPAALDLIPRLAAVWGKEKLTAEEVAALCAPAKKSYDLYVLEARTRMASLAPAHGT